MMFWIFAAFLTFFAALCVVVPFARKWETPIDTIEFDKAIYKARLAEIGNDLELGRISDEEAKAAISDEGRKLIALDKSEKQARDPSKYNPLMAKIAVVLGIVILPAAAMGFYLTLGSPSSPDQSLQSRLEMAPENQSINELISRAEAHLAKNPGDAQGWKVLAPVYSRLERFEDAQNAWANVYRLAPETPEIRSTLGESIVAVANGVVTADAQQLFLAELAADPSSAKARFYLAMALGQEGKHREAVTAWQELIRGGNSQSPWMEAAQAFLAESAKIANVDIGSGIAGAETVPSNQPGPNAEQIASASKMSAEDRNGMILGMVQGLSDKLAENPDDKAGWERLIRAYSVLGKKDEAAAAIEKAKAHFAGDAEFVAILDGFRKQLQ